MQIKDCCLTPIHYSWNERSNKWTINCSLVGNCSRCELDCIDQSCAKLQVSYFWWYVIAPVVRFGCWPLLWQLLLRNISLTCAFLFGFDYLKVASHSFDLGWNLVKITIKRLTNITIHTTLKRKRPLSYKNLHTKIPLWYCCLLSLKIFEPAVKVETDISGNLTETFQNVFEIWRCGCFTVLRANPLTATGSRAFQDAFDDLRFS